MRFPQAGRLVYDRNNKFQVIEALQVDDSPAKFNDLQAWTRGTEDLDDGKIAGNTRSFDHEIDYLLSLLDQHRPPLSRFERGLDQLLKHFVEWIPYVSNKESYVLFHPDLDRQNILVDKCGNVTGLIDWDGVAWVPMSIGCAYPMWLTRDWNPWNYVYPCQGFGRKEESPQELDHYRKMYIHFLEEASIAKYDSTTSRSYIKTVRKSLLIEKLDRAVKDPRSTYEIVNKIFQLIAQITGQRSFHIEHQSQVKSPCNELHALPLEGVPVRPSSADSADVDCIPFTTTRDDSVFSGDNISGFKWESTPRKDFSSRTSQVSNAAIHVPTASPAVASSNQDQDQPSIKPINREGPESDSGRPGLPTSKKTRHQMSSMLRKVFKGIRSHTKKIGQTRHRHKGTAGVSVNLEGTVFEVVDPQHMTPSRVQGDT